MPEVGGGWQRSGETQTSLKALRSLRSPERGRPGKARTYRAATAPLRPREELTVGFLGRPACARGSRFPPPGFRPAVTAPARAATSSSASSFQPKGATRGGSSPARGGQFARTQERPLAGPRGRAGGRGRPAERPVEGSGKPRAGARTPRCAARPVSRWEPDPRVTDRVRSCPSDG